MHILLWSTAPWAKTGYGKNCLYFMQMFKELGHEVSILVTYGLNGGTIDIGGVKAYPSNNCFYDMGHWLKYWENQINPDLIVQHFDIWTVEAGFILKNKIETPIITHTPIDSEPMPRLIRDCAEGSYDNLAMSNFAQRSFHDNNMISQRTIYHPVDNNVFKPMDKHEARKLVGLPENGFIIGCVGTNKGPRKNIVGQLKAFAKFIEDKRNEPVFMYLHSYLLNDYRNPEGLDIPAVISHLDLEEHVYYTDLNTYYAGFSDEQMRQLYSSFDVLSMCSMAEGFGIPIIEAQACGTPVITTNFSAMPEVVGEGGILVEPAETHAWQRLGCSHAIPKTQEITEAYQKFYDGFTLKDKPILNSSRFHINQIKHQWKTYLENI